MDQTLTIEEVARELGLPLSTVRYYRDRYRDFIPSVTDDGEERFRPGTLDVIRDVADGIRQGSSFAEIEKRLALKYPRTVEFKPAVETAEEEVSLADNSPSEDVDSVAGVLVPVMAAQSQALSRIATLLEHFAESETRMQHVQEMMAKTLERLSDRTGEHEAMSRVAEAVQLMGSRASDSSLKETAEALGRISEQGDEIAGLRRQLEEMRKAQEAFDLKRRIAAAKQAREQKELEQRIEQRARQITASDTSDRTRRRWWQRRSDRD